MSGAAPKGPMVAEAQDMPEHMHACATCAAAVVVHVTASHSAIGAVNTLVRAIALLLVGARVDEEKAREIGALIPLSLALQVACVREEVAAENGAALRTMPPAGRA